MQTKLTTITFAIAASLYLSSCATIPEYPTAHLHKLNHDIASYSYTSDIRSTHIVSKDSNVRICMEPAPDTAYSQQEAGSTSLSIVSVGKKEGEAAQYSEGSKDLPLVGRSMALLLARELNYRACEASINNNLSFDQYMQMYNANLAVIEKISMIEAGNSTTKTITTIGEIITTTDSETTTDSQASLKAAILKPPTTPTTSQPTTPTTTTPTTTTPTTTTPTTSQPTTSQPTSSYY